jgi:sulfite reductase alpha subunit-like flavoprotein
MSDAENKVEAAIENVAASEATQAAAATEVAAAVAQEKATQAAAVAVATAETAAALAEEQTALVQIETQKKLNETEGDLSWLRNHAQATENSLQNLHQSQAAMQSKFQTVESNLSKALEGLQLLIPKQSENQATILAEASLNAVAGGQPEAEPNKSSKGKKAKRWI